MSGILSVGGGGNVGGAGASFYPVTIDNSLRWPDSGCELQRTVGSPTDATKHTHAFWVKVNPTGTTQSLNSVYGNQSGYYSTSAINSDGRIIFGLDPARACYSTMVSRDPSSWLHILQVLDSTEASNSDRMKLYVNGVRQTSFSYYATVPSGWTGSYFATNGLILRIGRTYTGGGFNSSLLSYTSEYIFVDGQALDPTDFGQFQDGVWIPDTYAGTYGNNGYKLDFSNPANIGEDSSGNGNDFSVTALSAHDVMPDSPTNNFATWNPLVANANVYSEGNLKNASAGNDWEIQVATMFPSGISGKWYAEFYVHTCNGSSTRVGVGVTDANVNPENYLGQASPDVVYYDINDIYTGGSKTADSNLTFAAGDIISVALNLDDGEVTFRKNNSTMTNGTQNLIADILYSFATTNYGAGAGVVANFGQDSTFSGAITAGGNADSNGIGDFKYAVPSGFLGLANVNLPEPTIIDGSEHFTPYLYTADNTTPKSRTGVGFAPDFLWFKNRTTSFSHNVYDTVRGANKGLQTNNTNAENSYTLLPSFGADGFTTSTDGATGNILNYSSDSYVAWSWKAGGTAVSNNDGSITSQVSANVDAGFSIVSWTGTGANATVGHGLAAKPQLIFAKNRNGTPDAWPVYSETIGAANRLYLNLTSSSSASATIWNNTEPTAQLFSVGSASLINQSTKDIIAYCFHSVDGYSKVGSYVGNGSSDGPMIFTNFQPSFVLTKESSSTSGWNLRDSSRSPENIVNEVLQADTSSAEMTSGYDVDFLSNGFKLRTSLSDSNASGQIYLYLAIASNPFKYANAR